MPEKSRQTRKKVYDKRKFAAITIRIDNPKTTALLFSSGKLVVTGSVSRQMAMCAVRRIITELKSLALFRFVRYDKHIIQNIVCNVRLPRDKVCVMRRLYALLDLIAGRAQHKN